MTTECLEQLIYHGGKGCGVPPFGGLSFTRSKYFFTTTEGGTALRRGGLYTKDHRG